MKQRKPPITSLRIRSFKAVQDSGILRFGHLTAFIGDNGVGKSCPIDVLRFLRTLAYGTLDSALEPFGGYEHVHWNAGKKRGHAKPGEGIEFNEFYPIDITLRGHVGAARANANVRITGQNQNVAVFEHESLKVGEDSFERDRTARPEQSILRNTRWFDDWQFLDLAPDRMGKPTRRMQSGATVRLAPDGSNLGEYLLDLRGQPERGIAAFNGLVETLQVILPYVKYIEPVMSETFERQVGLRLHEGSFTVPGWMLSTGTLRLVALLAVLRHPRPPSVLCVEEIENGLDPRTIHIVVDELLRASEAGRTQILITTHSPYLLDLLPLDSLVLVARDEGGPPRFDRPGDHEEVRAWARQFAPGKLYTMGTMHQKRGKR
jgi:predicted ATPase